MDESLSDAIANGHIFDLSFTAVPYGAFHDLTVEAFCCAKIVHGDFIPITEDDLVLPFPRFFLRRQDPLPKVFWRERIGVIAEHHVPPGKIRSVDGSLCEGDHLLKVGEADPELRRHRLDDAHLPLQLTGNKHPVPCF